MSRNQYPDYISYLKKRTGDKEYNKGVTLKGSDASAATTAFQNAMFLNFYDVDAKDELKDLSYSVKIDGVCVQRGKACE
mgnify:CR=1 FL=1